MDLLAGYSDEEDAEAELDEYVQMKDSTKSVPKVVLGDSKGSDSDSDSDSDDDSSDGEGKKGGTSGKGGKHGVKMNGNGHSEGRYALNSSEDNVSALPLLVDYGQEDEDMEEEEEEEEIERSGKGEEEKKVPVSIKQSANETIGDANEAEMKNNADVRSPNFRLALDTAEMEESGVIAAISAAVARQEAEKEGEKLSESQIGTEEAAGKRKRKIDELFPMLPPAQRGCPKALRRKIDKYLTQRGQRQSVNGKLSTMKGLRNPYILEHLIVHHDLDELGSNFPKSTFDPHGFDESEYFDNLQKKWSEQGSKSSSLSASGSGTVRASVEFTQGKLEPRKGGETRKSRSGRKSGGVSKWDMKQ